MPYDFEVRPPDAIRAWAPARTSAWAFPPHIGRDGIPRLNIPYLTATGLDDGGGNTGQIAEGGRTYRLGDSDMVITIPEGLNVTNTTVALDLQAGDIFDLRDVATGNWVVLDFGFNEVRRSVDSEGAHTRPERLVRPDGGLHPPAARAPKRGAVGSRGAKQLATWAGDRLTVLQVAAGWLHLVEDGVVRDGCALPVEVSPQDHGVDARDGAPPAPRPGRPSRRRSRRLPSTPMP